tara:strand:- start:451 stop:1014 length:564 start_codon:yes stop_codon:yes gene_type:complete
MNQYNLKGIYKDIWLSLENAVVDRNSGFHTFALATINNGKPDTRTVVLRACDRNNNTISFHTNNKSLKIEDISKNNKVSALFYDKADKTQIRISGAAKIFNSDSYCKKKWDDMSKQSRQCYYQNIDPGESIDSPDKVKTILKDEISKNFTIINIQIIKIDWLYLSHSGHTRAKFISEDNFQGRWIAP